MRNPLHFFVELRRQPAWVGAWVLALMLVNLTSIGFWEEPLARLIFWIFLISAMLMMGIYAWFGFEKILGLAHVLWIPLLIHALARLPETAGAVRTYLLAWSAMTAVSLVLDGFDVWTYFTRRSQTQRTESAR
jgi:hypothetical protein